MKNNEEINGMVFLNRFRKHTRSQIIRRWVQLLFLAVICFTGFMFIRFAGSLESGILPNVERPAGVEAFLPISALVSLKYFVLTGIVNDVHPSALVVFLVICTTTVFVRKGFCAYICPFGLLSEYFYFLHCKIFKHEIRLPALFDAILRSIKYGLAGVFIYLIFFRMPVPAIEEFIHSPYHILADINMYRFFTDISPTALSVISGIGLMSVLIRNFWCRYLCPYGALLGILSVISLGRIQLNRSCCKDCGKCEKVCPGRIHIRQGKAAFSPECSACLQCVHACPEKGALEYSFPVKRFSIGSMGIALIFLAMFTTGITFAKLTGHWESRVSNETYFYHMMTEGMLKKTYR